MTGDSATLAAETREPDGSTSFCIGICSNRPGGLYNAVASVLALDGPPFEVIVVAQGGPAGWADDNLAALRDNPRLRIVYDAGRGVSRARNIVLRETASDIVVFTDDDCVADPHWLQAHADVYRRQPDVMMIFGTVDPPVGYIDTEGMVPTFDPKKELGSVRLRGRIALGLGANMSVRRSALEYIGYFDELLGPGSLLQSAEEFDLSLRATAAGLRVVAEPRAVIIHAGGVRPVGDISRTLWQRDGFAIGAVIAKQARLRHWPGVVALTGFLGGIATDAVRRLFRGRRPYRLTMAATLMLSATRGLLSGLSQPLHGQGVRATFMPPASTTTTLKPTP